MRRSSQPKLRLFAAAGLALVCGVLAAAVAAASPGSAERQGTGLPTTTGTQTGGGVTAQDRRVDFSAKVRKKQKLGRVVLLDVRCAEVCRVDASGRMYVTSGRKKGRSALRVRRFEIAKTETPMGVGERRTIKLKLPKNGLKVARTSLRKRGKVRAKIFIEVLDLAGNKARQVDDVTLRRR